MRLWKTIKTSTLPKLVHVHSSCKSGKAVLSIMHIRGVKALSHHTGSFGGRNYVWIVWFISWMAGVRGDRFVLLYFSSTRTARPRIPFPSQFQVSLGHGDILHDIRQKWPNSHILFISGQRRARGRVWPLMQVVADCWIILLAQGRWWVSHGPHWVSSFSSYDCWVSWWRALLLASPAGHPH